MKDIQDYERLIQERLPKRIRFPIILQVAAKGDRPIVIGKDPITNEEVHDPNRVHYGYGQRSALTVLLRALDAWKDQK